MGDDDAASDGGSDNGDYFTGGNKRSKRSNTQPNVLTAVTVLKIPFTGDSTDRNIYASRMMPPVLNSAEQQLTNMMTSSDTKPDKGSTGLPRGSPMASPRVPFSPGIYGDIAAMNNNGMSFAMTASALAAIVRAKYKAASFDPEAPKYFLPTVSDDDAGTMCAFVFGCVAMFFQVCVVCRVCVLSPELASSMSHHSKTKRRLAATIRNLSSVEGGEAKLMRDGALAALFELAVSNDLTTLRHVAAALCNLSCCKAVRIEMADCGVVVVLNGLAENADSELLTDVTACFVNLLSEVYCDTPVIRDGGLRVLIKLASAVIVDEQVQQNCVSAVLKLCSSKDNFARLMSEGASRLLVQMMLSENSNIRSMALSSLVYLSCYAMPRVSGVRCLD